MRKIKVPACPQLTIIVLMLSLRSGIIYAQSISSPNAIQNSVLPLGESIAANKEPMLSSSTADLPDAPSAQMAQGQQGTQGDHVQINPIDLLSPRLISGVPLSGHDKFEIYIHKTYSPAAIIFPLFSTGFRMANPNNKYPSDWQDGMGAFGRNYGDTIARRTAKTTAEFTTQVLLHEDPRYERSSSTNPVSRIGHAVAWTFFDKSDAGNRRVAFSNFAGAAASGFVGMGYMPDGFSDATHAEQRMLVQFGGDAVANILTEFEPTWGPIARKLHIPQILPAWWTPEHKPRP